MRHLAAAADGGFLDLHVRAGLRALAQVRARAQVGARAGGCGVVDPRLDGHRLLDDAAAADLRVGQARVRADDAVLADLGGAHEHDLGKQLDVLGNLHVGADPHLVGVDHGDAGCHVGMVDAALHDLGDLGQLDAGVDAQALGGVVGGKRQHGTTGVAADLKHVGEIELALGVVVADLGQRVEQGASVETVEAGVALVDRRLLGRGVLLLDDALDLAVGIADDAAVAGGVVQLHGEHHHGGVVLIAHLRQAGDSLGLDERAVAREHRQGTIEAGESVGAGEHRARRAVLHFLHHYLRVALDQRDDLLAGMADHRRHLGDAGGVGGVDHPAHERLAQNLVCHLGLFGLHAGARARSQNDSGSFHAILLGRKRGRGETRRPRARPRPLPAGRHRPMRA